MTERRQAARREPIEIEVADGRVFTAHPLPWMVANDLGNEIVRQNLEAANDLVKLWVNDAGLPEIEMKFQQKISDWQTVLRIAFPDVADEVWRTPRVLSSGECAELLLASLEVNHLEHLKHLVDPNSPTPTMTGGNDSLEAIVAGSGTKIASTPDSASVDSPERIPSV